MSVIERTTVERLPEGASLVATWGLLSRVQRACPDHGGECPCVARHDEIGLIFWCEHEEHHFSTR